MNHYRKEGTREGKGKDSVKETKTASWGAVHLTVSRVSGVMRSEAGLTKTGVQDSLNTLSYLIHLPYEATAQRKNRERHRKAHSAMCVCVPQGSHVTIRSLSTMSTTKSAGRTTKLNYNTNPSVMRPPGPMHKQ